jgi:hypothetical protein
VQSFVACFAMDTPTLKRLQNLKQAKDEGLITSPEYSIRREAALQPSDPESSAKRPLDLDACEGRPNNACEVADGSANSRKPWVLVQYFEDKEHARGYITSLKLKYTWEYGVRGQGAAYSCKSHTGCQHKLRYRPPTRIESGWAVEKQGYHINTADYVGTKVTLGRILKYKKSLEGTAGFGTSVEEFEEEYMSLHRVFYNKNLGNGKGKPSGGWQCECKGFWHSRQCAHVFVVEAVRKERNLVKENEDLLHRKKLGRKTKMKKALQRQEQSPVKSKESNKKKRVSSATATGKSQKKSRKSANPTKKASAK